MVAMSNKEEVDKKKKIKSYKDLDIYNMSFALAVEVHKLSLQLPKFELYEQGSQIRRSSKSIKDNIVEGYGRRKYKNEFMKFLIYAQASLLETQTQLDMLHELYPDLKADIMRKKYNELGRKLYNFITFVDEKWET